MQCFESILISLATLSFCTDAVQLDAKYEILSVETIMADPNFAEVSAETIRNGRIKQGISVNLTTFVDLDETFTGKCSVLKGIHGNQYARIPLFMKSYNFYEFMNGIYKNMYMDQIKDHSNMPVFDGEMNEPLPAGLYYLKNFILDINSLKLYVDDANYKIELNFYKDNKLILAWRIIVKVFH